jgi:FAD/FMN-containing dehydrogenase
MPLMSAACIAVNLAVALPATVAEVVDVVRWCQDHRIGLVPQGGNTSYCGGATPDASGTQLVLGLRRLNPFAPSTPPTSR